MNQTPTVEEFLAQQGTDDEAEDFPAEIYDSGDPLESIADSLRTLVGMVKGHTEEEQASERLQEAFDDLESKQQSLFDLLADVEKVVSKSTSKVSLEVKDAINAWRNPEVPAVHEAEPVGVTVPVENATEMGLSQPAHDADVEEWRKYARGLGYAGSPVDEGNRSQIRTLLGIEQPA